jgi:3-oxoacyl-(acyl-carrier-protein) synthase
MSPRPTVFVTGLGAVCAGAGNVDELRALLAQPRPRFGKPTVFPSKHPSGDLPVAEVAHLDAGDGSLPRTHRLALRAAREAVADGPSPDAIVLGTTTGGIATTEAALEAGDTSPAAYRFHGLDTVAQVLADALEVGGPVLVVSTACSSAAVAIAVAARLLRAGLARRVLAGGADSLSRLTFHGFRQLQLIAPDGCHPLDAHRTGMTVGEGAGFVLLEADASERPALAVLAGAGLSCDAYHATSPHPEGKGAALAIERALADATLAPGDVGYVNLHGTGTPDNDAAEAKAMRQVFGRDLPALSSTKGLTGHTLAAAGGLEAVISVLALRDGILPANTGLGTLDATLELEPLRQPTAMPVARVLSNSFGFGGNNACVVFEQPTLPHGPASPCARASEALPAFRVAASACLTARGGLDDTWAALVAGESAAGLVPDAAFAKAVPAAFVRRLKRLPRLTLALAQTAHAASGRAAPPDVIAAGTAWGPLAETHAFLRKLFESGDQFSSPMDFIGSVHNAPAAQVALFLGSQAPNLTCSAADRSFSQALLCASLELAAGAQSAMVLAAEAFEPDLSPLFEPEVAQHPLRSDGGAAFVLVPDDGAAGARLRFLGEAAGDAAPALLDRLTADFADRYDAALVGWPPGDDLATDRACADLARRLPPALLVPHRARLGQHASVSATAVAVAVRGVRLGTLPLGENTLELTRRRLLLVEVGRHTTCVEVFA